MPSMGWKQFQLHNFLTSRLLQTIDHWAPTFFMHFCLQLVCIEKKSKLWLIKNYTLILRVLLHFLFHCCRFLTGAWGLKKRCKQYYLYSTDYDPNDFAFFKKIFKKNKIKSRQNSRYKIPLAILGLITTHFRPNFTYSITLNQGNHQNFDQSLIPK